MIDERIDSNEAKADLWKREPHTEAKHLILDRYLKAWFPILAHSNHGRIIYLDGFSGPGEYEDGADGSPIIALKIARDHNLPLKSEMIFYFIDKNSDYCEHLKQKVEYLDLPEHLKTYIFCDKFDEHLTGVLNELEE